MLVLLFFLFVGARGIKLSPTSYLAPDSTLRHVIETAAYVSGTGSHYGFFAPGVVSEFLVDYDLLKGETTLSSGTLDTQNVEATFRLYNIVQNFWLTRKPSDENVRRALAASLAGKILGNHAEADGVRLHVRAHVLPSMREYKAGNRPSWEPYYQVEFHQNNLAGSSTP